MERKLVNNLYLSNNSSEIIDFLVDHDIMPTSFEKSAVITYIDEKDFDLVLFLKNEDNPDEFLRFRFADFSRNPDTFFCLNQVFKELQHNDPAVYASAKAKLEEMYHMIPVFRAYYYGHSDHLKEETYI